jgi:hypothetical protein
MSTVHWLDALTPPIENHLQKLAESIKALLRVGLPHAAPTAGPAPVGLLDQDRKPAEPGAAAAADKPAKRGMFQELMNFSYQRTKLQALGWYLIYLLIGLVIAFVLGRCIDFIITDPERAFQVGFVVGQFSAIPYNILLGTLLIWHRMKEGVNILLVLAGIVLSIILGFPGGLIPLAVLTCRP